MSDVMRILSAMEQGDPHAAEQVRPLVYDELRKLAAQRLAHEKPGQTLQPTALVHEAYLRLVEGAQPQGGWDSRGHFFAAAAEAMRRILIEAARKRSTRKRGGAWRRIDLNRVDLAGCAAPDDLLELDDTLDKLARLDATPCQIVKLRFFAGLSIDQAGKMLDDPARRPTRDGRLPAQGFTTNSRARHVTQRVEGFFPDDLPLISALDVEK
jgi:RNA polymerase sigma factor (TIGR02999 family)